MSQAGKTHGIGAAREVIYDLEARRSKRAEAANGPAPADTAGASTKARQLPAAQRSFESAAGVRAARIAELKSQIANGEYQPGSAAIAREMLERGF